MALPRSANQGLCAATNHYCSDEIKGAAETVNIARTFERFKTLDASARWSGSQRGDVHKRLDDANLGTFTLQSMVFEPATLSCICDGEIPASRGAMKTIRPATVVQGGVKK